MSAFICTIAGGKGGVGRTTTAINMGIVFEEGGYDTVLVDADLGMTNVGKMLDIDTEETLHDALAGSATVEEALTETAGGLTVIAGDGDLEAYAKADPAKLRDVIDELRDDFDVILIDTSPKISHEMAVPLGLADGILLVSTGDSVALSDTDRTAEMAERVDGNVFGVILARATQKSDVEKVREHLDIPILGVVPENTEAAREQPFVRNVEGEPVSVAYKGLTALLIRSFETDEVPAEMEPVFEASWFGEQEEFEAEDEGSTAEDDEEDDPESLNMFRPRF